jgi:CelD/BcsL family acetyltransferase involved in cellulose biosynthesis
LSYLKKGDSSFRWNDERCAHHIFTSAGYGSGMGRTGEMTVAGDPLGAPTARIEAAPAGAGIDVLVHRAHGVIDSLAAEWSALVRQAAAPNPFAEHWFASVALRTLGANRDIRLLEARRGSRLIGIMLISIERGYAHLPVRFVQNWYHDHIFLGDPLVSAGEEPAFWPAILATLNEADWAPGFLHLRGLAEGGTVQRALAGDVVHRRLRAFLQSDLDPAAYYAQAVRQKKRKELRRLRNRLEEIGPVQTCTLADGDDLAAWCDAYLALERAGWKGREGSGLACRPETERFFRETLAAARAIGQLQFLRLDVGDRPIAMLVNLLTPPGSYSFKTVFDEDYARFSPGVLIQIENLKVLERGDIDWMDSCAVDDHPMIDSLWTERRPIVRMTVPLNGVRRSMLFRLCRALEKGSAALRRAPPLTGPRR